MTDKKLINIVPYEMKVAHRWIPVNNDGDPLCKDKRGYFRKCPDSYYENMLTLSEALDSIIGSQTAMGVAFVIGDGWGECDPLSDEMLYMKAPRYTEYFYNDNKEKAQHTIGRCVDDYYGDWYNIRKIVQITGAKTDDELNLPTLHKATQIEHDDFVPLKIVSAVDFNSTHYERPESIVDDMLCPGVTMLASPPKYGKSFLSFDLALAIATGSTFLNRATKSGQVLYLDLEGKEWRTQDRLSMLGYSKMPDNLDHAYIADKVDHHLIRQLQTWVAEKENPRLIIIDTLARIKGVAKRNENDYHAETRFMAPLQALAMENNLAILCVTHTRKSGNFVPDDPYETMIGSTAQYGASDNGWLLTGKRGESKKILMCNGRDYAPLELELEFENGKWIAQGTVEEIEKARAIAEYNNSPIVRTIKNLVTSSGGGWSGTMQDLYNEIATYTKQYPETDPSRLGGKVRTLSTVLLERDRIITIIPTSARKTKSGRSERIYSFRQSDLTENNPGNR